MEANQVIEKILSDARAQADAIRRQEDATAGQQEEKLQIELQDYNKNTAELARKAAEEKKLQILARARMETAKEILAQKRKLIDEVFESAKDRLKKLPDNEYLDLMEKLILKAVQSGDEEVIVDKNETRISDNFLNRVNQKMSGSKSLRICPDREQIGAGFILKKDKIKTNVTIEVLCKQARRNLEADLAKELFR